MKILFLIWLGCLSAGAQLAAPKAQLLSGPFGFNNQVAPDLSGNGFTAFGTNTVIERATNGPCGTLGVWFPGTGCLTVADAGALAFPNTTFTVSGWIFCGPSAANTVIIAKDAGSAGVGWSVKVSTPGGVCEVVTKGSGGTVSSDRLSTTVVTNLAWHHFAAIITTDTTIAGNNTASIYVDGALSNGSISGSTAYVAPTLPVQIGQRSSGNNFIGALFDVRIYSFGLTAGPVQNLFTPFNRTIGGRIY